MKLHIIRIIKLKIVEEMIKNLLKICIKNEKKIKILIKFCLAKNVMLKHFKEKLFKYY